MLNMKKVDEMMMELGHPSRQLGYDYLYIGVEMYRPGIALTKELYPAIAKACCSTPSRVERAIRHNIETAWMRGSYDQKLRYFGQTIDPSRGKPTNGEYIDRLWRLAHED